MSCHDPNLEPPVFRELPENLYNKIILDVGFGRGIWGFLLKTMFKGKPYLVGVEPYKPYCDNQAKIGVYDEIQNCTIEDYLNDKPGRKFDVIIASEVLEHLDPENAYNVMDELKKRLTPDGVLIVTVPDGDTPGGEGFDGNKLHGHRGGFEEKEFQIRGFRTDIIPRLHISGRAPAIMGTLWHLIRRGKRPQGILAVWRPQP